MDGHIGRLCFQRHVGRSDGVLHLAGIEIAAAAQGFQHIIYVHIELFEHVGEQIAFFDDHYGFAVEQFAEAQAARREFRDYDVHDKECEDGNDAVDYGYGGVAHRNAGELARDEGYGEFEGLQFAQLPLAHKAHRNEQKEIDDYTAHKEVQHRAILPLCRAFMRASVPSACAGAP